MSIICYGILFEEGTEFPWLNDHEAWWRDVNGYEPLWDPYDKYGNYKPGVEANDPRISAYFKHRSDWDNENPFPVTLVDYGCWDFSQVILAVTSSLVIGNAKAFSPVDLTVSGKDIDVLLNFCRKWNIELDIPKWWLGTYQG